MSRMFSAADIKVCAIGGNGLTMGREHQIEKLHEQWDRVLSPYREALSQKLTEVELSALYSWLPDCFDSFTKVYHELIPALSEVPAGDSERILDLLYDIAGTAGEMDHIKSHLLDAEKGFKALLEILEELEGADK